ncbi:hypothetical protein EIN_060190 [Entamoeba invadens IP1]|uniref:hypothetical protein n=1 Tax=Entamoeba invadens IP1 TaxID=370355 RepID=UPI0002C3EE94|nr:hypothetical protein EIN_060190 [Entamoeba invadens IP1]ELP93504.1 hypothetical protein EIN_060190 [Entamoeba invadens IP1]|eukprot:XP_004260275.1 hypothetical protein EIN_060190 [Entamoeba invadens IP1]
MELIIIALLVCGVFSSEGTPEEVEKYIKEGGLVIVKYYKESCPFCVKIVKEFQKFENDLKYLGDRVHVFDIDCPKHKEFCDKQDINSFPTIVPYYHKWMYEELRSPREVYSWKLQTLEILNSPLPQKYIGKTKHVV